MPVDRRCMQRRQRRVRLQPVQFRLHPRQIALDGAVAMAVPVQPDPAFQTGPLRVLGHRCAAEQEVVQRPQRVAVELDQIVAHRLDVRPPSAPGAIGGDIHARPVDPGDFLGEILLQVAGAMRAQRLVGADVGTQRLETPGGEGFRQVGRRASVELRKRRRVLERLMPGGAEQPPCHRDVRHLLRQPLQQAVQRAVAGADVHEFSGFQAGDPVGLEDRRMAHDVLERAGLRGDALRRLEGHMGHDAHFLQPVEHPVGAVRAVVAEDQEMIEADGAVMGDPFQQIGALVADDRHDEPAGPAVPRRHHRDGIVGRRLRGLVIRHEIVVRHEAAAEARDLR